MKLNKIHHVAVIVSDYEKSKITGLGGMTGSWTCGWVTVSWRYSE